MPVALLSLGLGAPQALALMNLNEGRTRVTASSNLTVGYDSNLFANSNGDGDVTYSWDVSADLTRNAGLIGVNANVGLNATSYGKYTGENFRNPRLRAAFTKATGRMEGGLTLGASRQSRADTAANLRNESWLYDLGLTASYPVLAGRYSVAGNFNYSLRDFSDNSVVVDVTSISAGADLHYVLSDTRNLLAGYRVRQESTSSTENNIDHTFTLGVNGRIVAGINGQLRAGWVIRRPQGGTDGSFHSWTTTAAASWAKNKRLDFSAQVNKDFSTTSTNITVDSFVAQLSANYRHSSRTSFTTGLTWNTSNFLGPQGLGRKDEGLSWNFGATRDFHRYLRVQFNYSAAINMSSESFSDFSRESMSLSAITQL